MNDLKQAYEDLKRAYERMAPAMQQVEIDIDHAAGAKRHHELALAEAAEIRREADGVLQSAQKVAAKTRADGDAYYAERVAAGDRAYQKRISDANAEIEKMSAEVATNAASFAQRHQRAATK
jgi:hypothetical protein